ncbi:MAG: hypothetical protein KBB83_03090 [Alphaproteobacteria bacterium]|nr:hypothetical protein [Alphaproteobacteria bacterium]
MKTRIFLMTSVAAFILTGLTNIYLHQERKDLKRVYKSHTVLAKKQQNRQLPIEHASISQRLALPSSRLSASDVFKSVQTQYKLQRLDFQIAPEIPVNKTSSHENLRESDVEIKFLHNHDTPVFLAIQYIIEKFPGLVYPTEISLWRDDKDTNSSLKGHFHFQWLKTKTEEIEG